MFRSMSLRNILERKRTYPLVKTVTQKEGDVVGRIVSFYYIGDHYNYTVRSDNDIDYVVDDEDLWNQDDKVSVILPRSKMKYRLVNEDGGEVTD